jgi:hypothetical protein
VAIRSTVGRLKEALEVYKEREVSIGEVEYGKDIIEIDSMLRPIVHKRRAFRHDQEVRAIVWEMESEHGGKPKPPFGEKGVYVPVNVESLFQEVVVSPLGRPGFEETVREVTRAFGVSSPVNRSQLLDRPNYRTPLPP